MACKKIALLYLTEPYQALHMAPLAVALEKYPSLEVKSLCADKANFNILKTLYTALNSNRKTLKNISCLKSSFKINFFSLWTRLSGSTYALRYATLQKNADLLQNYDALIGTENTLVYLRKMGITRPKLILVEHGIVAREVLDEKNKRLFDLLLFDGTGSVEKTLKRKNACPEAVKAPGYMKLETCQALRKNPTAHPPYPENFALFNPHVSGKYSSMKIFLPALCSAFSSKALTGNVQNLLIAPHIKYQHKFFDRNKRLLKNILSEKVPHVHFSKEIWPSINMDLTRNASLYIGDVSSQIYEFLIQPRPCIFLNPYKIDWKNSPGFAFWHCGEVVEAPEMLLTALNRAEERHAEFLPVQKAFMSKIFNGEDGSGRKASERAADLVIKLLT